MRQPGGPAAGQAYVLPRQFFDPRIIHLNDDPNAPRCQAWAIAHQNGEETCSASALASAPSPPRCSSARRPRRTPRPTPSPISATCRAASSSASATGSTTRGRRLANPPARPSTRAFFWSDTGGLQDIGDLPGGSNLADARAINNAGSGHRNERAARVRQSRLRLDRRGRHAGYRHRRRPRLQPG